MISSAFFNSFFSSYDVFEFCVCLPADLCLCRDSSVCATVFVVFLSTLVAFPFTIGFLGILTNFRWVFVSFFRAWLVFFVSYFVHCIFLVLFAATVLPVQPRFSLLSCRRLFWLPLFILS